MFLRFVQPFKLWQLHWKDWSSTNSSTYWHTFAYRPPLPPTSSHAAHISMPRQVLSVCNVSRVWVYACVYVSVRVTAFITCLVVFCVRFSSVSIVFTHVLVCVHTHFYFLPFALCCSSVRPWLCWHAAKPQNNSSDKAPTASSSSRVHSISEKMLKINVTS